ncbi:MAG TPA: N-glycosylase/DNA lyase [Candidatus Nanoarchaeia archaeon]|nr:N-glycosylase/DNA lyase [Candidatus Nanoarchaeia archaeon]
MRKLIQDIREIPKEVREVINQRMKEFSSFAQKPGEDWFSELCFCILTANSKAMTAIAIQNELKFEGFSSKSQEELSACIKKSKHRFHNNKSKYILEARKHIHIKSILNSKTEAEAREWLVQNIKGLGYKEASHFLRNTGSKNVAILDRHILALMHSHKLIAEIPKPLNKNKYLEIEQKFNQLASKLNMTPARLDLAMWYLKTGKVLK